MTVQRANDFEVRGPGADSPIIEAWSDHYIPFEPKADDDRRLRQELRDRLERLRAEPGDVLHAEFAGVKRPNVDVENTLLYNVDTTGRRFQPSASGGVLFEHAPAAPDPAPSGSTYACRFRYCLRPRDQTFGAWRDTRELARWGPLRIGSLSGEKKLEQVWWSLVQAEAEVNSSARAPEAPFAVRLGLHPPGQARIPTVALVKGLFDGVVCAFQAHRDRGTSAEMAELLSQIVDGQPVAIAKHLVSERQAVLGAVQRLVHGRGAGVQWAPADNLLVAGSLSMARPQGTEWRLAGTISEVAPR